MYSTNRLIFICLLAVFSTSPLLAQENNQPVGQNNLYYFDCHWHYHVIGSGHVALRRPWLSLSSLTGQRRSNRLGGRQSVDDYWDGWWHRA